MERKNQLLLTDGGVYFEPPASVRFPGSQEPKKIWTEPRHPSKLHKSVHTLFSTLKARARVTGEDLTLATLTLHRAGFGLVVYRSPRPGCIHVFNKKFGSAPIALVDEPLPIGLLTKAVQEFL